MILHDRSSLFSDHPEGIKAQYERGFVGYFDDPDADAKLFQHVEDMGGSADAGVAFMRSGIVGSGAGKLSLPFMAALRLYPGSLPGGAQKRGDCVSWTARNGGLVSYCASLLWGSNDEGNDAPPALPLAVSNGVMSTETYYWYRGYDGDGWTCGAAANVAMTSAGLVLRQPYADLGIDLTRYSPKTAGLFGRRPPTPEVRQMTSRYLLKDATRCTTWEQVRDSIANGNAVLTCGMEAWSDRRDQNGVCDRKAGTWAHAIAGIAADDRPEIIQLYGEPLLLMQNSWDEYMTGGRTIFGTSIQIPPGSFWTRWSDAARRGFIAIGAGKGWPARLLPNWGLEGAL